MPGAGDAGAQVVIRIGVLREVQRARHQQPRDRVRGSGQHYQRTRDRRSGRSAPLEITPHMRRRGLLSTCIWTIWRCARPGAGLHEMAACR